MTSHYMSELELTVDHLVGISNGKIVIDAPTKDILKQFGSFEEAYFKGARREKKVNNMLKRSFLVTFINIVVYLLLNSLFFLFLGVSIFFTIQNIQVINALVEGNGQSS